MDREPFNSIGEQIGRAAISFRIRVMGFFIVIVFFDRMAIINMPQVLRGGGW